VHIRQQEKKESGEISMDEQHRICAFSNEKKKESKIASEVD
jgi:hypothetical protein